MDDASELLNFFLFLVDDFGYFTNFSLLFGLDLLLLSLLTMLQVLELFVQTFQASRYSLQPINVLIQTQVLRLQLLDVRLSHIEIALQFFGCHSLRLNFRALHQKILAQPLYLDLALSQLGFLHRHRRVVRLLQVSEPAVHRARLLNLCLAHVNLMLCRHGVHLLPELFNFTYLRTVLLTGLVELILQHFNLHG